MRTRAGGAAEAQPLLSSLLSSRNAAGAALTRPSAPQRRSPARRRRSRAEAAEVVRRGRARRRGRAAARPGRRAARRARRARAHGGARDRRRQPHRRADRAAAHLGQVAPASTVRSSVPPRLAARRLHTALSCVGESLVPRASATEWLGAQTRGSVQTLQAGMHPTTLPTGGCSGPALQPARAA